MAKDKSAKKSRVTTITFWVTTALVALLFGFSGGVSAFQPPDHTQIMLDLGYPGYFIFWLGIAKILGVLAFLQPKFPKLKEWAYAGFTFDLIGALVSMINSGQPVSMYFPLFIFLAILGLNYFLNEKRTAG